MSGDGESISHSWPTANVDGAVSGAVGEKSATCSSSEGNSIRPTTAYAREPSALTTVPPMPRSNRRIASALSATSESLVGALPSTTST